MHWIKTSTPTRTSYALPELGATLSTCVCDERHCPGDWILEARDGRVFNLGPLAGFDDAESKLSEAHADKSEKSSDLS